MAEARKRTRLCALDDLREGDSRAFSVVTTNGIADIFLVRKSGQVFGYVNSCPHTGAPLDWVPGRFLDLDSRFIQCATHDARFCIEDGHCVAGPCRGASLTAVRVEVLDDAVFLTG
jgi:nitrite reductase/ring-hydroxylating ferredoxin subunit